MNSEDINLQLIKQIADKSLTYNKDINQHIESCKISMLIINQKEETITILREMLAKKDEEIRNLVEENMKLKREKLMLENKNETELDGYKEIIKEQYNVISNLLNKDI